MEHWSSFLQPSHHLPQDKGSTWLLDHQALEVPGRQRGAVIGYVATAFCCSTGRLESGIVAAPSSALPALDP